MAEEFRFRIPSLFGTDQDNHWSPITALGNISPEKTPGFVAHLWGVG